MTETQQQNVKEIAALVCGKSLQVDLFEGNKYYFETPDDFVYRVTVTSEPLKEELYSIGKYNKAGENIWYLTMGFHFTAFKKIIKLLESK